MYKFQYIDPNWVVHLDDKNYVSYNSWEKWFFINCEEIAFVYNKTRFILEWDLRKEITECKNIWEVKDVFRNSNLPIINWSNITTN